MNFFHRYPQSQSKKIYFLFFYLYLIKCNYFFCYIFLQNYHSRNLNKLYRAIFKIRLSFLFYKIYPFDKVDFSLHQINKLFYLININLLYI